MSHNRKPPLEFLAPDELRAAIKCFWYSTMDFGKEYSTFEVMPDGYAEIIFHFSDNCSFTINGVTKPLPSPVIMGLLNQPVTISTQDQFRIVGVRCFPWAVFDLLGLTSGKDSVRGFEHPIAGLQSILRVAIDAGRTAEAVDILTQYFLDIQSQVGVDSILFKAGVAMIAAKGTMPVTEVASSAHATLRTLERKFKQSSGHTVKDVSGLMRFEQVRNQLWANPYANIAGLAHELGYADQSHLSREFKRYSGVTPAAFARKAKQDTKDDFVAFIQG